MKIIIRVDASIKMGSGHVMRCLTLSEALKNQGAKVEFICREHEGNLVSLINSRGFNVHSVPAIYSEASDPGHSSWLGASWQEDSKATLKILKKIKADWLIVDHYALDIQWEKMLRPLVKKIMVIDDLADRQHDCNLLLDQNFYLEQNRYAELVPQNCRQLIGLDYLLLRQEFIDARQKLSKKRKHIRRVLVFFGGSDITNETGKSLAAIIELNDNDLIFDVIIGSGNKHQKKIKKIVSGIPTANLHIQTENMAELMLSADLFIGAGGSVTWERCFLKLPGIVITLADNQVQAMKDLEEKEVVYYLGKSTDIGKFEICEGIKLFLNNPQLRDKLLNNCHKLIDGQGTDRVTNILMS
jgi:UDP-2,4-diacetamido-2,4,6-trideoxy-beta-L-altropyranose hydrolase